MTNAQTFAIANIDLVVPMIFLGLLDGAKVSRHVMRRTAVRIPIWIKVGDCCCSSRMSLMRRGKRLAVLRCMVGDVKAPSTVDSTVAHEPTQLAGLIVVLNRLRNWTWAGVGASGLGEVPRDLVALVAGTPTTSIVGVAAATMRR